MNALIKGLSSSDGSNISVWISIPGLSFLGFSVGFSHPDETVIIIGDCFWGLLVRGLFDGERGESFC